MISAALAALAAVALSAWLGLLAFPRVLCGNRVRAGSITLHYDAMPAAEADALVGGVERRLAGSGLWDPAGALRACVFRSPARYRLLARLAAVPAEAQGFNLSVLGQTFVSAPRVEALGERSGGGPRYSVWEGDLAHTVAHELAHQILADRLGRRDLPPWKREGLAEYIANIALIREDPEASFGDRLAILDDLRFWNATRDRERHGWDRTHYEAGLLVEYLVEVEGFGPEEIAAESVTLETTRAALRRWSKGLDVPAP